MGWLSQSAIWVTFALTSSVLLLSMSSLKKSNQLSLLPGYFVLWMGEVANESVLMRPEIISGVPGIEAPCMVTSAALIEMRWCNAGADNPALIVAVSYPVPGCENAVDEALLV